LFVTIFLSVGLSGVAVYQKDMKAYAAFPEFKKTGLVMEEP
jgi:hypothetical protein